MECYENNITVSYIGGHHHGSVLTIYQADKTEKSMENNANAPLPVENIDLTAFQSVESMHELFQSKGFIKKSPREVESILTSRRKELESVKRAQKEYLMKLREQQLDENPYFAKAMVG